jgi:transcriptional regulator GlxA family with amidase domain
VGATFLEYLNNVRLAKAHQLLLNTKLPITKIAALTGFSSGVQLSRTFQSVYKESPAAFRRKSAGKSLLKQPK